MSESLRDRLAGLLMEWRGHYAKAEADSKRSNRHGALDPSWTALKMCADGVEAALGAVPETPVSKSWQTLCPDCDHGIRGGAPCETCNGEGSVSVVFASEQHEAMKE